MITALSGISLEDSMLRCFIFADGMDEEGEKKTTQSAVREKERGSANRRCDCC